MQKINFNNLPDTTTPVNASNLNTLQTNVENEFTNYSNKRWGYLTSSNSYSSLNDFKESVITSSWSSGCYMFYITISGSANGVLMMKASNSYLSFILFSYNATAKQYKYNNGTWTEVALG